MVEFRNRTGGFELRGVGVNTPLEIAFTVKEKSSPVTAIGRLKLEPGTTDDATAQIAEFGLRAIPPNLTAADMDITVDAAMRARILDGIDAKLTEFYIYPPVAKKMIKAMRDHDKAGDYTAITSGAELARKLSDDLRAVSHDGHLRVEFMPERVPEGDRDEPTPDEKDRMREELARMHCGFVAAKKLDGNIGYIKLDMFAPDDICGPEATKSFAAIEGVDAVIIDLRDNGGGQPEMVSYVASYLFAKRTHVNDLYDRKNNKTTQYWTKPDVPGTKLATQPVYVLTSKRTFSGAEEFSYDVQTQKRATIVGETTGGGAHPTAGKRLDDHFVISVPFARPINPITKKDWEGTGVVPDVKVSADDALETATKLATEAIAKRAKSHK